MAEQSEPVVAEPSEPARVEPSEPAMMEKKQMQSFDTPNVPPTKQKSKVVKHVKKKQYVSKQGNKRITRSQTVALEDKIVTI